MKNLKRTMNPVNSNKQLLSLENAEKFMHGEELNFLNHFIIMKDFYKKSSSTQTIAEIT